jgi:hypothetical protein
VNTAAVIPFPGAAPPMDQGAPPTMTVAEIVDISGGYTQPAAQLKALLARGFVRAHRLPSGGRVILERSHYEAVTRGHFVQQQAANEPERPRAGPNRAGFRQKFGKQAKA